MRTWLISSPQRRAAGTPAACSALLEGVDDVDHEHQAVGALDARVGIPGRAVAFSRRDRDPHPAAYGLYLQALVPARDHLLGRRADEETKRRSRRPGRPEDRLGPPDVTGVLRDDELAR